MFREALRWRDVLSEVKEDGAILCEMQSLMADEAGVPENLAANIVGHEKPRITYNLYSGGFVGSQGAGS